MESKDVVAEAVERLTAAGLLRDVAGVRLAEVDGVYTAVVIVPSIAPGATLRLIDDALAGMRHQRVRDDRRAPGAVHGQLATKDGQSWPIGTQSEVAWINDGTTPGLTIVSAVPPVYEAYATIAIAEDVAARRSTETLLLGLLGERTALQPWWLGYLDTGAHDVVFDRASKVIVYSGWSYVLVQAGPRQAGSWRKDSDWRGCLPDLIFPTDHSWLISMLWDDDWRCVGGPADLIRAILAASTLDARSVDVGEDATPPGRTAI